ncbi:MAG: LytR C-terminal domain-containing protein [Candidatus Falkowbacteria bacterium]|nr:MAG: LytR C-terminal domain-containing protein [Candidatus Falkowbacteria bacterium]
MLNNKKNINNKINKDFLIYPTIFIVYFLIVASTFAYSIKFLSAAINSALAEPQNEILTEEYASLKLKEYSLIAKKLNLNNINISETENKAVIETSNSSSSLEIINPTTDIQATSTNPATSIQIIENLPKILVTNSTLKPGLATKLKTELENNGFEVAAPTNSNQNLDTTTIKIKAEFTNSAYFNSIKNIVSENYNFIILPLADENENDIEIVIGNN